MTRNQILALLAAGALAGTGALLYSLEPGPGGERRTYRALAITDCLLAKADAGATPVDCVSGRVVVPIEASTDTPLEAYEVIPGSEQPIATKAIATPQVKALVSDCIAGELRKDTSQNADGSQWWMPPRVPWAECDRARLQCRSKARDRWLTVDAGILEGACWVTSPVEIAGGELWPSRAAEHRPELVDAKAEAAEAIEP